MNDALKIENNDIMNKFQKTENILNDVQNYHRSFTERSLSCG